MDERTSITLQLDSTIAAAASKLYAHNHENFTLMNMCSRVYV